MAAVLTEAGLEEELAFAIAHPAGRQGDADIATPAEHGLALAVGAAIFRQMLRHGADADFGRDAVQRFGQRIGRAGGDGFLFDRLQAGGQCGLGVADALAVECGGQGAVVGLQRLDASFEVGRLARLLELAFEAGVARFKLGNALGQLLDDSAQAGVIRGQGRRAADQQGQRGGAEGQGEAAHQ